MDNGLESRLRIIVGPNAAAFSAQHGIPSGSLSQWLKGQAKPGHDAILAISKAGNVSIDWLLTGRGPKKAVIAAGSEGDLVLVKQLDVAASAGNGLVVYGEDEIGEVAFDRRWLLSLGVNPANVRLIQASGDSMEPLIRHADLLMVDTGTTVIIRDGIYVMLLDGALLVKQVTRTLKGVITIESRNQAYASNREIFTPNEAKSLQIAGKVIWFGRSIG